MPWKVSLVKEERFKFILAVQKSESSFSQICDEFGISRQTGYKWWNRYSEVRDPVVLEDQSKAPLNVAKRLIIKSRVSCVIPGESTLVGDPRKLSPGFSRRIPGKRSGPPSAQ